MTDFRSAIAAALDRVAWTLNEAPPTPGESDLPYATYTGVLSLPGLPPLDVVQLSDGRRVIPAESMEKLFAVIGDSEMTPTQPPDGNTEP